MNKRVWIQDTFEIKLYTFLYVFRKYTVVFLALFVVYVFILFFWKLGRLTAELFRNRKKRKLDGAEPDAVAALVALGVKRPRSIEAVLKAQGDLKPSATVEDVLRQSLKYI